MVGGTVFRCAKILAHTHLPVPPFSYDTLRTIPGCHHPTLSIASPLTVAKETDQSDHAICNIERSDSVIVVEAIWVSAALMAVTKCTKRIIINAHAHALQPLPLLCIQNLSSAGNRFRDNFRHSSNYQAPRNTR